VQDVRVNSNEFVIFLHLIHITNLPSVAELSDANLRKIISSLERSALYFLHKIQKIIFHPFFIFETARYFVEIWLWVSAPKVIECVSFWSVLV